MEKNWVISVCVKLLLILILPFGIALGSTTIGYDSLLLRFGLTSYSYLHPQNLNIFVVLLSMIILLAPAVAFNYVQFHKGRDESILKFFAAGFAFGNPFVQTMLAYPLISLLPIGDPRATSEMAQNMIYGMIAANWGVLFLIVIPFLMRESKKFRESGDDRMEGNFIATLRSISRSEIIALLLGVSIYLIPFAIAWQAEYSGRLPNILLLSGASLYEFTFIPNLGFEWSSLTMPYYPLSALASVLLLYFSMNVIAYLQGRASRNRCMLLGVVASIIGPILTFMMPLVSYKYTDGYFPIPITLLIGFVVILRMKPIYLEEPIWDEKIEKERTKMDSSVPSQHEEDESSSEGFDWDKKKEDVFGNDTAVD